MKCNKCQSKMIPISDYRIDFYVNGRHHFSEFFQNNDAREDVQDRVERIFPNREYGFTKYSETMRCVEC